MSLKNNHLLINAKFVFLISTKGRKKEERTRMLNISLALWYMNLIELKIERDTTRYRSLESL